VLSFTSANSPAVPTLLSPSNKALLSIYAIPFDWNDVATADHYQVQVATSNAFSDASIVFDTTTSPSQATPSLPLLPNRTFYWRVRAYNVAGEYSLWSSVWQLSTRLPTPILFSPQNAGNITASATFDWADVSEATGYVIQISTKSTFTNYVVNTTVSNSAYSKSLVKGVKYYWRVYAKGTHASLWSEVRSFITQ
jgi:hypothetical protein